ncbi:MAG: Eco57I restriction-modification methylase domain-containing protein, partial [Salinispira sp.]
MEDRAEIKTRKSKIVNALKELAAAPRLHDSARAFYAAMGYESDIQPALPNDSPEVFFQEFLPVNNSAGISSGEQTQKTRSEKETTEAIRSLRIVFQLGAEHITEHITEQSAPPTLPAHSPANKFTAVRHTSCLFIAADLKDTAHSTYSRSRYANMTREMSRRFPMPVFVLFRCGRFVSLAFADRRDSRRPGDNDREVLGRVSLVREIDCSAPHAGHVQILAALSLPSRLKWIQSNKEQQNFEGLRRALLSELNSEELNKRFYNDLFAWFEWASQEARFPQQQHHTQPVERHIIRLITRMLFIWFLKEKNLVANELFTKTSAAQLLKNFDIEHGADFYRAILQNLFFAVLNTEIGKRAFSEESNNTHRNFNCYRYADLLNDGKELRRLMDRTPFINGGLFDCLDSIEARRDGGYRLDCFTDNKEHRKNLCVPDKLFFDPERGILPLFNKYKFTVEENTPIDQDVALDPELLGRVFENLLAACVPETHENARKKTGSYYTPRAVVDYMVNESLLAYVSENVSPEDGDAAFWQDRLRYLLDYADAFNDAQDLFKKQEREDIVHAIADVKALDPAVGSGAFPMGMLHKLVLVLSRLDDDNALWRNIQKERAKQRAADAFDHETNAQQRRERLQEINDTFESYSSDFGRKLLLIQNSIFGVDIQPVACQIAKLRVFISLVIEQEASTNKNENYGIKPLPNLETRFVAANSLLGLDSKIRGKTFDLIGNVGENIQKELKNIMERHFNAHTRREKLKYIAQFKEKQRALANELKEIGFEKYEADKIAQWNPYDLSSPADWFDAEYMFGEKNGFDIVIGNPPYVRQERITEYKPQFRKIYKNTYTGTADMYVYFYEAGMNLLNSRGHLCYITSNKWMRAKYGEKLRHFLKKKAHIEQIIDFAGQQIFEATVDTNILLCGKSTVHASPHFSYGSHLPAPKRPLYAMLHNDLDATAYILQPPPVLALKRKIEAVGTPLKDWDVNIYYGIKTGYRDAFIIDTATRDKLIAQDPKSAEIIKPILRGRDIKAYEANWAGLWVIATFPALNINIDNYVAVKNHLLTFGKNRLEQSGMTTNGIKARKKTHNKWFETQDQIAYYPEFEKEKIVYPI